MNMEDRSGLMPPRFPSWQVITVTLVWSLGIATWQTEFVSVTSMFYILPVGLLVVFRTCRIPLLFFCVAVLWGGLALLWDAKQLLIDDSFLHHHIQIEADIVEIRGAYPKRITLNHVQHDDEPALAGRIWVYVYQKTQQLRIGQRIHLTVKLHRPRNRQNPGGFDFRSYCFSHHISALGHSVADIRILKQPTSILQKMRERVIERLSLLPDTQRGVLQALLLGDRQHIPLPIQEAFSASGAAHLLAISGLHMGMLSAWMVFLCWWLLTRHERNIVTLPVRGLCLLAALLACVGYATLAAWPLPAQRAVLMLAAFVLAWWMRQRHMGLHTLCMAWMFILFIDPASIASISLWLSFVAAGALIIWAGERTSVRKRDGLSALFWVSCICFLVTLVFVVHAFGRFPFYSLIVNILLVPLFSFWVLPTALLGEVSALCFLPTLADLFFQIAAYGLSLANKLLLWLYSLPAGNFWLTDKSKWISGLYFMLLCSATLLLWRGYKRQASVLLCLNLLCYTAFLITPSTVQSQWVIWDVGQGSAATLITNQAKVLHVDIPGKPDQRFNGGTTVASGLRTLGVTHLDALVLSHAQQDHIGGTLRLFDQMNEVKELWLADVALNREHNLMQRIINKAQLQGTKIRWLSQGQSIALGNTTVRVLWPPKNFTDPNRNQLSLVLSIEEGIYRFLLAGDIEHAVEKRLIEAGLETHEVLLMPHHGSKSSNTQAWVDKVSPQIAIAQTGYKNRYGFPSKKVLQRYENQGSRILNTAQGAVLISMQESDFVVRQWHLAGAAKQQLALQWWQGDL